MPGSHRLEFERGVVIHKMGNGMPWDWWASSEDVSK